MREKTNEIKIEYCGMLVQLLADVRAQLVSPLGQPRNPSEQSSPICISTKGNCDVFPKEVSPTVYVNYELFNDDVIKCLVGNLFNYIV